MPNEWESRADGLEEDQPRLGRFPIPGLLRSARRIGDLSQRQMATSAGVAQSTVAKVEAGSLVPSVDVLQRLLATARLHLAVVDDEGRVVQPMRECDDARDGAERRYPSHLDTILDPRPGEWWADEFGLARPPETFFRDRKRRDEMRARSRWEVRVKQLRNAPEPPRPGALEARIAAYNRFLEKHRLGLIEPPSSGSDDFDWDQ